MDTAVVFGAKALEETLRKIRIPQGTESWSDYQRAKRVVEAWLTETGELAGITYEQAIRVAADWVGV